MDDLRCPDCGSPDAVPVRYIERSGLRRRFWLFGELVAASRKVGKVYRCSRCASEFCTGPHGVYVPQPRHDGEIPMAATRNRPPPQEQVAALRDQDQRGWD